MDKLLKTKKRMLILVGQVGPFFKAIKQQLID